MSAYCKNRLRCNAQQLINQTNKHATFEKKKQNSLLWELYFILQEQKKTMPYKVLFIVIHKSQLEQDKHLHVHMYNVEIKPD